MSAPAFFAVPDALDDPERVSGGNVYDRRVRDALLADGWDIRTLPVAQTDGSLAHTLGRLPDDAAVLIDGLLVGREPAAIVAHRHRLRMLVLAHMVAAELGDDERDALRSAVCIIATSRWTRAELIAQDAADPRRIVVAHPGTDAADATVPSASGSRLLCVAAVAAHKGQDLLVTALAGAADIDGWSCTFAGSLATEPEFAAAVRAVAVAGGIADRVAFRGVLTGRALRETYAAADLAVLPSRSESYGMAVADALAHGIPVLTTGVGGISEAVGDGRAAMIVPPDDPWALGLVLRQWWADPARRQGLRAAAMDARGSQPSWAAATQAVAAALSAAAHAPVPPARTGAEVRS
ncbi:glycosyltransferase family 4 protein [Leifsonia lichenia]